MGVVPKRNRTAENGENSLSRSGRGSSGRNRDKHSKSEKEMEREKSFKYDRDKDSGTFQSGIRGGSRSRRSSNDVEDLKVEIGSRNRRTKLLDPILLARGMSSRSVGARVGTCLRTLSSDEVERDLRHIEAYSNACIAYAQQFFAFKNRELVTKGIYGPVQPAPGSINSQVAHDNDYLKITDEDKQSASTSNSTVPVGGVAMPVRIDPEEEKRFAILRKKIAASEAKREILETEYLSLRAHYVHESRQLSRVKNTVQGKLTLLQDLVNRRGEVLALRRVRCAMAKDVLCALKYRAHLIESGDSSVVTPSNSDSLNRKRQDTSMNLDEVTEKNKQTVQEIFDDKEVKFPADPLDVWILVESQLQIAISACMNIDTPKELLTVKNSLAMAALKDLEVSEISKNQASNNGITICLKGSPVRSKTKKDEDEIPVNGSTLKKKSKLEKEIKNHNNEKGNKSLKKSQNVAENSDKEVLLKHGSSGPLNNVLNKKAVDGNGDKNIIPWNCQSSPRTPYGVSVLLSCLSDVPDGAVAYGECDF